MRITEVSEFHYSLTCKCTHSFRRARPQVSFQCPACAATVCAGILFAEWVFENGPMLSRLVATDLIHVGGENRVISEST